LIFGGAFLYAKNFIVISFFSHQVYRLIKFLLTSFVRMLKSAIYTISPVSPCFFKVEKVDDFDFLDLFCCNLGFVSRN
jgi:hypothetical protein